MLGVTYTIDWNGTITKRTQYMTAGDVVEGSVSLSPADFHKFYAFAENAYKKDPYKDYSENVIDGSTYGFRYYPQLLPEGAAWSAAFYALYAAICFLPAAVELKEAARWKYLISKI